MLTGKSKRDLENSKYIIRHRTKQHKRSSKNVADANMSNDQNSKTTQSGNGSCRKNGGKSTRVRKNQKQQDILECEFAKALEKKELKPNQRTNVWNKAEIQNLANKIGLSEGQIYKWQWDRQNKQQETMRQESI